MNRYFFLLIASLVLLPAFSGTLRAQGKIAPPPPMPSMDLWDVAALDSMHIIAVGDYGIFRWTTNGGSDWVHKLSAAQFAFRNVRFFDRSTGIASGFWSTLFRTTDSGRTWSDVDLGQKQHLPGMSSAGNRHAWLSGAEGCILRSDDAGLTWTRTPSGTTLMLDAIAFADTLNGWCSSVQGLLLRSTDGGRSWTEQNFPTPIPVTSLYAVSPTTCWAAGYNGLILKTEDGGNTWSRKDAYATDYTRIRFDSGGIGWAVGKRGTVSYSTDHGEHWRLHHLVSTRTLNGICFPTTGMALVVGAGGAIDSFKAIPEK